MIPKVDHYELEIEEDLPWTERSWKIQRAGWVLSILWFGSFSSTWCIWKWIAQ